MYFGQFSYQHVSAAIAAIFNLILLKEYKYTNVGFFTDVDTNVFCRYKFSWTNFIELDGWSRFFTCLC